MTFSISPRPCAALSSKFFLDMKRIVWRFLILALAQIMLVMPLSANAMLPTPLSEFDAAQYLRLFDLQQQGNMKQATREMGRLEKSLLKGHLLSQRYLHPTAWRSSYAELSAWLKVY